MFVVFPYTWRTLRLKGQYNENESGNRHACADCVEEPWCIGSAATSKQNLGLSGFWSGEWHWTNVQKKRNVIGLDLNDNFQAEQHGTVTEALTIKNLFFTPGHSLIWPKRACAPWTIPWTGYSFQGLERGIKFHYFSGLNRYGLNSSVEVGDERSTFLIPTFSFRKKSI